MNILIIRLSLMVSAIWLSTTIRLVMVSFRYQSSSSRLAGMPLTTSILVKVCFSLVDGLALRVLHRLNVLYDANHFGRMFQQVPYPNTFSRIDNSRSHGCKMV